MKIARLFSKTLVIFISFSLFPLLNGCGSEEGSPFGDGGESLTLAWDAPVTNADGSPISDYQRSIAGYKLYYSSTDNRTGVINVGSKTSYTAKGLSKGVTYTFRVTAYNHIGNESEYSGEIVVTLE